MALPKVLLLGGDGGRSGVPSYIRHLARAFDGRADCLVASERDTGGYGFAAAMGLRHVEVAGLASSLDPRRIGAATRGLAELVRREGVELVWANSTVPVLTARLVLARARATTWTGAGAGAGAGRRRFGLIASYHGLPFGPGRRRRAAAAARLAEATLLTQGPAHRLVFLSAAERDGLPEAWRKRHRVSVVANCSDLGPVAPAAKGPCKRLVMTTRDAPQKNLPAAARVLAALPEDWRLELIGTGTDTALLKRRLAEEVAPGVLARIGFNGAVADVRPWLAQADVYLMTSRYEGMSIGALEAFEAGLPIVTSPVSGSAEIAAAHPFARIVPADEPAAMARAAEELSAAARAGPEAAGRAIAAGFAAGGFGYDGWAGRMRGLLADELARLG